MTFAIPNSQMSPESIDQRRRTRMALALSILPKASLLALVAIMIAGIVATFLFFQTLKRVSDRQNELAANSSISLSAVSDIQVDVQQLTTLARDDCEAAKSMDTWIKNLPASQRSSLKDVDQPLNDIGRFCTQGEARYAQLGAFYAAYVPAVTARQKSEYSDAKRSYQAALSAADGDDDLRVRALEGLAYSEMKRGQLDAAGQHIAQAVVLNADYVFSRTTQIKIACQRHAEAAQVRALYNAALSQRNFYIQKNRPNPEALSISNGDLKLLTGDPEIRAMCGYAGLR